MKMLEAWARGALGVRRGTWSTRFPWRCVCVESIGTRWSPRLDERALMAQVSGGENEGRVSRG